MSTATVQPHDVPTNGDIPAAMSGKSAFQKRIDSLVRSNHESERLAADLRSRVQKLEAQVSEQAAEIVKLTQALRLAADVVSKYKAVLKQRRQNV